MLQQDAEQQVAELAAMIQLPSRGSAGHEYGECKPCAWFWKPQGCTNGADCLRCHACAAGEIKNRRKRQLKMMKLGMSEEALLLAEDEVPTSVPSSAVVTPRLPSASTLGPLLPPPTPPSLASLSWKPLPPPPAWSVEDSDSLLQSESKAETRRSQTPYFENVLAADGDQDLDWGAPPGLGFDKFQPPVPPPKAPPVLSSLRSGEQIICEQPVPPPQREVLQHEVVLAQTVQDVRPQPQAPQRELPTDASCVSLGSALHATGTCTPCAWFWKPQGCQNGLNCGRCHLCPKGEVRFRKKAKVSALQAAKAPGKFPVAEDGSLILD